MSDMNTLYFSNIWFCYFIIPINLWIAVTTLTSSVKDMNATNTKGSMNSHAIGNYHTMLRIEEFNLHF